MQERFATPTPSPLSGSSITNQGNLGSDCTFFGFSEVSPSEGRKHWFVIEEPDKGFRFWGVKSDLDSLAVVLGDAIEHEHGGAHIARARFANPIRIMIRGDRILPDDGTGGGP